MKRSMIIKRKRNKLKLMFAGPVTGFSKMGNAQRIKSLATEKKFWFALFDLSICIYRYFRCEPEVHSRFALWFAF